MLQNFPQEREKISFFGENKIQIQKTVKSFPKINPCCLSSIYVGKCMSDFMLFPKILYQFLCDIENALNYFYTLSTSEANNINTIL